MSIQRPPITEATGYVGNFVTRVKSEGRVNEIKHGAAVIAIGADVYKPTEYLYGEDDRVMTHLELEERIAQGDEKVINAESLVMIQCVGCRKEDRNYCSPDLLQPCRKERLETERDQPPDGYLHSLPGYEDLWIQRGLLPGSVGERCKFIRYEPEDKPQVEAVEEEGRSVLRVTVTDPILGKRLAIDADFLSLAAA